MGQYSKTYSASFTSDGAAEVFSLAYLPRSVFMLNKTQTDDQTSDNPGEIKRAWGYSSDANGVAYFVKNTDAATTDSSGAIASGGFSFVTKDTPRFGATQTTGGAVSQAGSARVTITGHGYQTGDHVWLSGTTGMLQVSGVPYYVTRVDANNFDINVDSSGFAAAGTAATVKQFLYPDLYVPFGCVITGCSAATSAVVQTNVAHQFVVGQVVRFAVPTGWGMVELDTLEGNVTAIGTTNFTVDIDSSAFTAFAYPTSATYAAGMDNAWVYPVGDTNFGFVGPTPNDPLGIPGAFAADTQYQVIVGIGDGTTDMHNTGDICEVHFEFPDQPGASVAYAP